MGWGCGTAVEHMPHNQEVVGLNPAGCWAFFFFFLPNQVSQNEMCCERNIMQKNGCLAELLGAKQAQKAQIESKTNKLISTGEFSAAT